MDVILRKLASLEGVKSILLLNWILFNQINTSISNSGGVVILQSFGRSMDRISQTSGSPLNSFRVKAKCGLGSIFVLGIIIMTFLLPGIAGASPFHPCISEDRYDTSSDSIPTPDDTGAHGSGNIYDVINRLLGTSYTDNDQIDQYWVEPDYVWTQSFPVGQVVVISYRIGNSNTLGVYDDVGAGTTRTWLLGPYTGQTGFVAQGTQASPYPAATFNIGTGDTFGWILETVNGGTHYWFSEPPINDDWVYNAGDGIDHIMTYHLPDLAGVWVKFGTDPAQYLELEDPYLICFEDLPTSLGDQCTRCDGTQTFNPPYCYRCYCDDGYRVSNPSYGTWCIDGPDSIYYDEDYSCSEDEYHLGDEDYDDMCFLFDKATPVTGLNIVKTNNKTACVTIGDVVKYTYTVTNTGNIALSGVEVTDNMTSPVTFVSGDTNSDNKLDKTETWIYNSYYTVTEANICGPITNLGRVNATDPLNPGNKITNVAMSSVCTYYNADFTIEKIAEPDPAAPGGQIDYTIWINNTGNVNLSYIDVTDTIYDTELGTATKTGDDQGPGVLNVSENWMYTFSITVPDDLPNPWINNTVTADFTDPCGTVLTRSDWVNVTILSCQTADAGEDKIICGGDTVIVEGVADHETSVLWVLDSWEGTALSAGTFETPYNSDPYKASYTPPPTGVTSAVLNFTVDGDCPTEYDNMTVVVIERPDAEISLISP